MTFLAAWLLAIGVTDAVRPGAQARRRHVLLAMGAVVTLWALLGAPIGVGLVVWVLLAGCAVAWVVCSSHALEGGTTSVLAVGHGPRTPARRLWPWALAALGAGTALALGANAMAPPPAGPLARWYASLNLRSLQGVDLAHAALIGGALLVQVGTANVVVRLALDAAGARSEPGVLRGGRIVGPLERLFIVGLGLAGQVAAASIVIAAKGLLRFPELQKQGAAQQRIDAVTEYFLVGSFVSWLVALVGICLARA